MTRADRRLVDFLLEVDLGRLGLRQEGVVALGLRGVVLLALLVRGARLRETAISDRRRSFLMLPSRRMTRRPDRRTRPPRLVSQHLRLRLVDAVVELLHRLCGTQTSGCVLFARGVGVLNISATLLAEVRVRRGRFPRGASPRRSRASARRSGGPRLRVAPPWPGASSRRSGAAVFFARTPWRSSRRPSRSGASRGAACRPRSSTCRSCA